MSERRKKRCLGQKKPGESVGMGAYLGLVPSEPFRLFFPAGVLVSVIAALLWPMHYAGWVVMYPAVAHARLMIDGFVAAFAVGFMGTAGPRFLGAPKLTHGELVPLFGFYLASVIAQLAGKIVLGDILFVGFLCLVVLALAVRIWKRTSTPPPGMLLAGMGLACAVVGAFLIATEPKAELTSFRYLSARLLLHEGFILMPLMGIGGFLFPRFFGQRQGDEDEPKPVWIRGAVLAIGAGVLIVVSLLLDAAGHVRVGGLLRAAAAGGYILITVPEMYRGREIGTMAWCLRAGIASALVGLVAAAFFPEQRVGLDHLLFIAGYGLTVFTVGARVLFGHAGELASVSGKFVAMRWVLWLTLFAAGTRVIADFVPKIRITHHIYAALLWAVIVVIWAWVCLPKVRRVEADD